MANILGSFAEDIAKRPKTYNWWIVLWKVILLIGIINGFWGSQKVKAIGEGGYLAFLLSFIGPSLIYFSTQIIIQENFLELRQTFFSILCVLHLWALLITIFVMEHQTIWVDDLASAITVLILLFYGKKVDFVFKFGTIVYLGIRLLSVYFLSVGIRI
ncbi:hypothetical protein [Sediminitomix flava]|nr:hypothetical protein [Sediminitomix flava]